MRTHFSPIKNPLPHSFPLPKHLNEFADEGVKLIPISLFDHRFPNMKRVVAAAMLEKAKIQGELNGKKTIIEATSGNTGAALGMVAPFYGIRKVLAVVKWDTAPGKLEQLRFFGVQPLFPDPEYKLSPVEEARRLAALHEDYFNPDQYRNTANWEAHFEYNGPHVWSETGGKITVFCAAMGTTGTIVGIGKFLRAQCARVNYTRRNLTIMGGVLAPGHAIPGVRTEAELQPDFKWRDAIDKLFHVEMKDSYRASREMCQIGEMYGPSSGVSLVTARQAVRYLKENKILDRYRNEDGEVVVGFTCGDGPHPYYEKYSKDLDSRDMEPLDPACITD